MGRLPGQPTGRIRRQKHTLYQQCFDQGLQREEFVVFCIEPQESEMTLGPVVLD